MAALGSALTTLMGSGAASAVGSTLATSPGSSAASNPGGNVGALFTGTVPGQGGYDVVPTGYSAVTSGMNPQQFNTLISGIQQNSNAGTQAIAGSYAQGVNTLQQSINNTQPAVTNYNSLSNQLQALLGLPGANGQPALTSQQIQAQLANMPGYQYQLQMGQQQVGQSAASQGLLGSGAVLQALDQYGQGLASTSFQNMFGDIASAMNANTAGLNANTTQSNNLAQLYGQGGTAFANNLNTNSSQLNTAYNTGATKQTVTQDFGYMPSDMSPYMYTELTGGGNQSIV